MIDDTSKDAKPAIEAHKPVEISRRQSLKQLGRFAAATAPAMLVLIPAEGARACESDSGRGKKKGHDGEPNGPHSPM